MNAKAWFPFHTALRFLSVPRYMMSVFNCTHGLLGPQAPLPYGPSPVFPPPKYRPSSTDNIRGPWVQGKSENRNIHMPTTPICCCAAYPPPFFQFLPVFAKASPYHQHMCFASVCVRHYECVVVGKRQRVAVQVDLHTAVVVGCDDLLRLNQSSVLVHPAPENPIILLRLVFTTYVG